MMRGRSGRDEFTDTTMANRSLTNCTTEPGGYTPIMRIKAPSTAESKRAFIWANSTDKASWGVNAMLPSRRGLQRLS